MKKAIAIGVLLLGAVIFALRDRAPTPAEVERAPIIYPTSEPTCGDLPVDPVHNPGRCVRREPCPAGTTRWYWLSESCGWYCGPCPGPIEAEEQIPSHGHQSVVVWGPCEDLHSSRMDAEDAWLRKVLASTVDGDPLFGVAAWSMEAAECAARRWRLAGQ
jgi:hypothetical protein